MSYKEEEISIYKSRTFLDPDGKSLAALAASVDVTIMSNGHKYLDVGLSIIDNDGEKVYLGFWDYGFGEHVDETHVLCTLRDEIDKLVTAIGQAKAHEPKPDDLETEA